VAKILATTICSASAKREAQIELLAIALDVLDQQRIVLVGTTLSAAVSSEQVAPRSTNAVSEGVFGHGSSITISFPWSMPYRELLPILVMT
jgi:hypothetical protein